ncbi:polyhydroxyalkanoate synthesis regulator phasin [Scopulibacillus darangshiensis]|uniref:Polyhydroxyalkanoate synthesis regulator phasin n=1 Tax=Scopulibacillus darangshiensis TaxID=442528 RepID=A0A4R2P7Q8_9BACL|nr:hypothetical protein [Scopulibacillus darangshiensis]TCP30021.1 polyhydroxyalkanoate synthesis regulator phasin [Scopulibacillus darangshiensis]
MNDLLKKGFYLGLGAAFAGKEKAEKYINELAAKGDIAPSEAKKFIDGLGEKGKGKKEEWNDQFRQEITSMIKGLGFITEEDLKEVKQQLNTLEEKLDSLVQSAKK